jgi:hypothetical protein
LRNNLQIVTPAQGLPSSRLKSAALRTPHSQG